MKARLDRQAPSSIVIWALVTAPFLYLVAVVATCGVDVPYWDHWSAALPLIEKTYRGNLTFHNLWHQHNEHRLLFPRLVMIPLARMTSWNIRYELWVNVALSLISFGALTAMIRWRGMQRPKGKWRRMFVPSWVLPGLAVLLFSLVQWKNWLWGFQMAVFLNTCAVILAIACLASTPLRWRGYLAALFLAIVGSYSFANGLVFWPIGLAVLLLKQGAKPPIKAVRVVAWGTVGALTWILYFTDFLSTRHPHIAYSSIAGWVQYVAYVVTYLGSPLSFGHRSLAFLFGLAGFLALVTVTYFVFRSKVVSFDQILPILCLGAYSLGSALVTGIGRSPFGSSQALASRYTSVSVLFWIALILLQFAVRENVKTRASPRHGTKSMKGAASLVVVFVIVVAAVSSVASYDHARKWRERLTSARKELLRLENDDLLARLYPRPDALRIAVKILKRHNLSVFRDRSQSDS